jgi:LysR family transcriptional activator of nhaA
MSSVSEWINYSHLYYFKTIAEEGSVSKAAQKLRLGQPTLSAQLKQLESSLGIELFIRKKKRLHLSEQGKVALKYAQNIFKLGNEMNEVIKERLVPLRPHLQIGALDSIPKQILTQMASLAYKIANCKIRLIEGKEEELLHELDSHRIDIVVTNSLPTKNLTKEMRYKSFTSQQISVFGSHKYKSLQKIFHNL